MKKHAVLSAVGRDRVGVADDLSTALANRSIRIEDSRMTALRGRFALLVQVGGARSDVLNLRRDLPSIANHLGFEMKLETIEPLLPRTRAPKLIIESFSSNPAGLNVVTGLLKRHEINIEELQTETSDGPFNSRPTFYMKVRVTVPANCSSDLLKTELHELERERGRDLDIVIKEDNELAPL